MNVSNKYANTPLQWAAINGHATVVEILENAVENAMNSPSM